MGINMLKNSFKINLIKLRRLLKHLSPILCYLSPTPCYSNEIYTTLSFILLVIFGTGIYLFIKRKLTYADLSSNPCNLPTVVWTPRFANYMPARDCDKATNCTNNRKLTQSNITNILPRMERLNGPYGMYATVYGISTKVIHVAHPIPARYILMGEYETQSKNSSKASITSKNSYQHGSSIVNKASIKAPAYNHFKNFSGDGVFTADGPIWKSKRTSVLHCLLKGITKDDSDESIRLIDETNRAADSFIYQVLTRHNVSNQKCGYTPDPINIVPLLQRSTIGLIYRFITHHDVEFHNQYNEDDGQENKVKNLESIKNTRNKINEDNISMLDDDDCDQRDDSIKMSNTIYLDTPSEEKSNDEINDSSPSFALSSESSTSSTSSSDSSSSVDVKISINNKKNNDDPNKLISSYLDAVTNIRMIILAQSRSIWFLLPSWIYRTFSPMYREEERNMIHIRQFARSALMNSKPGSPLYKLRSRPSHNPTLDSNIMNGLEVNQSLLDEAITLLFAGQDTSAATLSWTLHLLALNPRVKKKLADEVLQITAKYSCHREMNNDVKENNTIGTNRKQGMTRNIRIDKKMISEMTYLDAVIKESMRLYPVAPFVVRRLPEELTIPGECTSKSQSITVPKDTFACIWIYGLHRNSKLWNKPNEFIPERWLDKDIQILDPAQHQYSLNGYTSYMPFAAGPRNCVGQPLAHVILRIMLSKIMLCCDFVDPLLETCATSNHHSGHIDQDSNETNVRREGDSSLLAELGLSLRKEMQAGFTVLPSGGVNLTFKER